MGIARKVALVTGVNGFVGSHLAEHLMGAGWKVHGTIRSFRSDVQNLAHMMVKPTLHHCDILDQGAVARTVSIVKPTAVFHLAAQSYVPDSWTNPHGTMTANVNGTLNVLEAIRHNAPKARLQVAGTSEQYGMVRQGECPITEENELRPMSPYGVSKVAADLLTRQYVRSYGLWGVVTRAFNHSGPRRSSSFAESSWARQIALAERTGRGTIEHGNLQAIRDYTDVRDIVRGYVAAAMHGKPGEVYVLTSGCGWRMARVLDFLVSQSTASMKKVANPALMRPSDIPRLIGDASLARRDLGWSRQFTTEQMLQDLLGYWRERVMNGER